MSSSSLEITENEYCIKLNRDTFDLSLVRQLIKRIQAEALFFSSKNENLDDDIISRNQADFDGNFDYLDDK
ncbi:MAG: hypothetical protein V4541_10520 [Bacteroidota bacterium]